MAIDPRTTFHDTALQVRSVVDVFQFMSAVVVPFLKLISGGSEEKPALNSLSVPCKSKMFEWIEDSDPPFVSAVLAGFNDSTEDVTVTAVEAQFFPAGTVYKVDAEYFCVKATTTLANPVKSFRGFAGTTAAAHLTGAVVTIVGHAALEEKDFAPSWTNEVVMPFNYIQLLEESITVSEMAQLIETYGADDALERETGKKTRRLMRLLNRSAYYGKRYAGTATIPSMMGGLDYFIPAGNVTDLLGGTLETSHIETRMRAIFDSVGADNVPDTIICNSFVRTRINRTWAADGVVNNREMKEKRAGLLVDYIDTQFGTFDMMLDHDCPPDTLYMVKADSIGIGPLAGMAFKRMPLALNGPVQRFGIYGSYTMQVLGVASHAKITGIALS